MLLVLRIFRKKGFWDQVVCVCVLKHKNYALSHVSLHMYFETKKLSRVSFCQTLFLVLKRPLGVLLSLSSKMEEDAAQRQSKQI